MSDSLPIQSRVSRRKFIKAAGLGGVGLGLAAAAATAAEGQGWDGEADILIVGTGGAGMSAACSAIQNGAKSTTLLEKAVTAGGTTIKSGGGSYVPNNHMMKNVGFTDNKEDFLKYCARVAYPELYNVNDAKLGLHDRLYALLSAYYDNAGRVYKTLNDT